VNAQRRAQARDVEKLARARERLAKLDVGGDPSRPIDVPSASVVDVHARAVTCARCSGASTLVEHAAETVEAQRLRVVRVRCTKCGAIRVIYFRIAAPRTN
jgi:ribosomal protein S27AE